MIFRVNMAIFNSYVKLPEGILSPRCLSGKMWFLLGVLPVLHKLFDAIFFAKEIGVPQGLSTYQQPTWPTTDSRHISE